MKKLKGKLSNSRKKATKEKIKTSYSHSVFNCHFKGKNGNTIWAIFF